MTILRSAGDPDGDDERDYEVDLCDGWKLWRHFVVRGAGMPASDVLRLADGDAAAAADAWDAANRALHQHRALAVERSRAAAHAPPDDHLAAKEEAAARLTALENAYVRAERKSREQLLALAHDHPRFREALTWQNRAALTNSIRSLERRPTGPADSAARRAALALVRYLQRYTVRNDSIGFFGPTGWGRWANADPAIDFHAGPSLVARSRVFFEFWVVQAVADRLGALDAVRPHLRPRRSASVRLSDGRFVGADGDVAASADEIAAFRLCDKRHTAREIAMAMMRHDVVPDEAAALATLASLAERGIVHWSLDLPTVGQPHEASIEAELAAVEEPLRCEILRPLHALQHAKEEVAAAHCAGDVDALSRALDAVDDSLSAVVGANVSSPRGSVARTPLYLDCARDISLALGRSVLDRLARPLSLLLYASRCRSADEARAYEAELLSLFAASDGAADGCVELSQFLPASADLFPRAGGATPPSVEEIYRSHQSRWEAIFDVGPSEHRVSYRSADIAERVRSAFPAAGPGFPSARYHSPDVMIAASSVAAIRDGDFFFVLGELHPCRNTLEQEWLVQEHPCSKEMLDNLLRDQPRGRFSPVVEREFAGRCHLTPYSNHPADVAMEFDSSPSRRPAAQTVAIADLVVRRANGRLFVETRDGGRTWPIMAVFDSFLMGIDVPLLPQRAHQARITVDDLVIQRESWNFDSTSLPTSERNDAQQFAAIRSWARRIGFPRFVFYRQANERKPIYCDWQSPALVASFVRAARASQRMSVSEMLPSFDDLWLVDGEANRYVSELRMVAVDPSPWNFADDDRDS